MQPQQQSQLITFSEEAPKHEDTYLIEKSKLNIHQTFGPKVNYTAAQAKVVHAIQYVLQQHASKYNLAPDEFIKRYRGNLTLIVEAKTLRKLTNVTTRNNKYVISLMDELKQLSATYDTLSDDPKNGEIGFLNFLLGARYTSSHFEFLIPDYTVRSLMTNQTAAIINILHVANKFDSKYAIFINDLVEEQSHKLQTDDFTFTVADDILRNKLTIPYTEKGGKKKYSYPSPSQLQQKAIQPAVAQIKASNVRFEIKESDCYYQKVSGVVYWTFTVVSKKTRELHNFLVINAFAIEKVQKDLKAFGITASAITDIVTNITNDKELHYVQWNIDIVKSKISSKTITKTPAAAFMSIYKQNREEHDKKWAVIEQQKAVEISIQKAKAEAEYLKRREALTDQLAQEKAELFIKQLKKDLDSYPYEINEFVRYLSVMPTPAARSLKAKVLADGLTLKVVEDIYFQNYIKSVIKKSLTEEDVDAYMESVGSIIEI